MGNLECFGTNETATKDISQSSLYIRTTQDEFLSSSRSTQKMMMTNILDFNKKTWNKLKKKMSIDDFQRLRVLGKGAFGTVSLVKHKKQNKYYALKVNLIN